MKSLKKFLSLILAIIIMLPSSMVISDAKTTTITGDINCDGEVSAADARLTLRFSANLDEPTEEQKDAADVNNDGEITASDARKILRVSAGLEEFDNNEETNDNNNNENDTVIDSNKINIAINEKDFSTKTGNLTISGTVTFSDELSDTVYIRYDTYSEDDYELKNSVFSEQTIAKNKTWEFKNVHVLPGNSTVVISAIIGEIIHKETIHAYFDQGERYNEVNEENIKYDETLKTDYINNVITIFLNDNTDENNLNTILKNFGGEIVGRSSNIYDVKLNYEYTLDEIEAICDKLEKYDEIFFAHAHYVTNITNNTSIRDSIKAYEVWENNGNWGIEAIEVPSAWNYKEWFSDINIGVVDTGFDLDHEDLKGKLYPATDNMENINDYNYWDTEEQVEKINSHGTIVAGIIGAIKDKKGITGILDNANIIYSDWQPNETKLKQSWNRETAVLQSLVDSVKSGAKIINYSLGSSKSLNYNDFLNNFNCNRGDINQPQEWKDKQAEIASEYILTLLRDEYDFLIVQAAGNGWKVEVENEKWEQIAVDATNTGFWSCITKDNIPNKATEQEKQYILDSIIVVGNAKKNSDGNYQQATSSNGGKRVDICAPGTDIFSTEVNNSYDYSSGTSVAAPHVTGVCGMVWSVNPDFSCAEVKEIVCNYTSITVHDNPDGNHPLNNTYPMVNAKLAVEEAIKRTNDANASICGVIKDTITDEPLQNIKVSTKINGNERYVKTDKNGNFILTLPEGEYEFTIEGDGYTTKIISEKCKKNVETVLLDTIYLTPTSWLMGTVIDKETNKPVEHASVLLQKIDNGGLIVKEYVCSTDKDGKFEINIPVGNYIYTINKLDMLNELYEDATGTVTVSNVTGNILGTVYLSSKNNNSDTEERTVIDSGNCGADGDNVTWTLYEDGKLVISGSGEMEKFYSSTKAPWYSNREIINNISIDYGITNISSYSFYDCKNLTDIKIPDSVTIIDSYSFYSCENLTDIKIPDSVAIISIYAFSYCESLADIIIPNNVTEIQNWAFAYTGLVNVIIPENVKTIGGAVFYGCENLETVKILNGVEGINTAYSHSYKLECYYGTFEECKNLKQISIPNSVTNIGVEAFAGCSSLENISIPDSVTSIGGGIFYNCSSLKSVDLSNNITSLSNSYYYSSNSASSYTTTYYHGFFEGCTSLCEINIPESVTDLGIETFAGCTDLTAIIIPDSVVSIGGGSFYNCSSLENVRLSNNVKELSYTQYGQSKREINGFFEHCSNLETVTIPNGLTLIDAYTFRECSNLKSITIPNSVKTIGQEVFSNCCSLNNIVISNSITEIPDKTFYNCSNLSEVEIPNSIISIGGQSFENCINIKKIKIPDSVISIYYSAFEDCTSLSDIDIGNRTQYVGKNAFYNTAYYNDSSNWDNGILYIETILIAAEKDISDSIFIKSGTTVIAGSAFANCNNFSQINIPETVTKISSQAFYGCNMLERVTIPLSVATIESGAFSFCKKLSEITILNPNCEIADYKNTICTSSKAVRGYYYNGKITGYRDSTAEIYAKKYNITFVALD